ncbi:hypothetical protein ACJX0J_034397 [Zea mays]
MNFLHFQILHNLDSIDCSFPIESQHALDKLHFTNRIHYFHINNQKNICALKVTNKLLQSLSYHVEEAHPNHKEIIKFIIIYVITLPFPIFQLMKIEARSQQLSCSGQIIKIILDYVNEGTLPHAQFMLAKILITFIEGLKRCPQPFLEKHPK